MPRVSQQPLSNAYVAAFPTPKQTPLVSTPDEDVGMPAWEDLPFSREREGRTIGHSRGWFQRDYSFELNLSLAKSSNIEMVSKPHYADYNQIDRHDVVEQPRH
jgi:hypothetical protein